MASKKLAHDLMAAYHPGATRVRCDITNNAWNDAWNVAMRVLRAYCDPRCYCKATWPLLPESTHFAKKRARRPGGPIGSPPISISAPLGGNGSAARPSGVVKSVAGWVAASPSPAALNRAAVLPAASNARPRRSHVVGRM